LNAPPKHAHFIRWRITWCIHVSTLTQIASSRLDFAYTENVRLSRRNEVVNGKVRKYYRITEKGVNALVEAKPKIKELVDEVI